jgi:hypothetical protein
MTVANQQGSELLAQRAAEDVGRLPVVESS